MVTVKKTHKLSFVMQFARWVRTWWQKSLKQSVKSIDSANTEMRDPFGRSCMLSLHCVHYRYLGVVGPLDIYVTEMTLADTSDAYEISTPGQWKKGNSGVVHSYTFYDITF